MLTDSILHLYDHIEGELVEMKDGFHNKVYSSGNLIFRVSPSGRRKQKILLMN